MFTKDIAIDLGTSNTTVYAKGRGVILSEPSVVAYDVRSDIVKAVGNEAKDMIGRTPGSIVAVKPLKDGVIADFDVTAAMIKRFIHTAMRGSFISKIRVMVCVPSGVTEVESRAVYDAVRQAGASANEITIVEQPLVGAIGSGIKVDDASGNMVVVIGGGTTEIAVVSLSDIVTAQSVKTAGDHFDEAIVNYVRKRHNLLIGDRTAERIKLDIGSVLPYENEGQVEIKGRNIVDGLPKNVTITSEEIREVMLDLAYVIIDEIKLTFEKTPPELAADIIDTGITLMGGGALIRGIDKLIADETGLSVTVAENPTDCVIKGMAKKIESNRSFNNYVFRTSKRYI